MPTVESPPAVPFTVQAILAGLLETLDENWMVPEVNKSPLEGVTAAVSGVTPLPPPEQADKHTNAEHTKTAQNNFIFILNSPKDTDLRHSVLHLNAPTP